MVKCKQVRREINSMREPTLFLLPPFLFRPPSRPSGHNQCRDLISAQFFRDSHQFPVRLYDDRISRSSFLTEPPGLPFGFQQRQDIAFAHRTFDISDQLPVLLVQEFHLDLRALPLRSRPAEDLHHSRPDYGFLHDLSRVLVLFVAHVGNNSSRGSVRRCSQCCTETARYHLGGRRDRMTTFLTAFQESAGRAK